MQTRRTVFRSIALTIALAIVPGLQAYSCLVLQGNSADPDSVVLLQAIKVQALQHSMAFSYVKELSDTLGPRLTGSVQAKAACEWAVQKMKRIGLQDVHQESWRLGRSWQRGPATAKLLLPFQVPLNIASYGWVGSTKPGGVEADVVTVNSDLISVDIKQHSKSWSGKILFMAPLGPKHINPLRVYSQLELLLTAAVKVHAVAVIYATGRPGVMLTHTGPAVFHDTFFPIPVLDIAPEHQQLLQRLLGENKVVRIKLDVENTVSPNSVLSANVVGDIPGAEHPEEVVLLCAHIDSWDLGTGAIDDGFGVASILAAADAILGQQVRARRTIRLVLFTGEEEGLLGSLAFVRSHHADLKHIVCAFAVDWGSGPIVKIPLAGHDEMVTPFQRFARSVSDLGEVQVDTSYLSFTDGYSFTLAGIPGIAPLQDSPNYVMVGHSAADTLDKVDRKNLVMDTAMVAAMGFWVANYPTRLAAPWTHDQTINALVRDNQKTLLELFGMWPSLPAKH